MTITAKYTNEPFSDNQPPTMQQHRLEEFDKLNQEHLIRFLECGVQPLLVITMFDTGNGVQLAALPNKDHMQVWDQPEARILLAKILAKIALDMTEGRFP